MGVDDINRMNELRRQGRSLQEIGDSFGISYLTVRKHVDKEFGDRKAKRRSIKHKGVMRPKPEECELCGIKARLEHHHWNDDEGDMGAYLCWGCHRYWEAIDYDDAHGEGRRRDVIELKRWEEKNYEERCRKLEELGPERTVTPLLTLVPGPTFDSLRAKLQRSAQ